MYYMYRLLNYISIEQWGLVWVFIILLANFSVLRKKVVLHLHLFNTKLYPFQNLSLGFILKLFLKFRKFQPGYSYKTYSYKKKSVFMLENIFLSNISRWRAKICLRNTIILVDDSV